LKLQNWVLELWSNYEIATDRFFNLSPPCARPTGSAVRRRSHLAAPRVAARPKPPSSAPCIAETKLPCRSRRSPRAPTLPVLPRRHGRPPLPPVRAAPVLHSPSPALPPRRRKPAPSDTHAPIKAQAGPLRAPRAPQPPLPWLPSSARRGAPFSGHPRPEPTPEMEPHRPPEALRPILSLIPSPEHGRRRADPPPAAPLRGPASSDPLPTSHGHPKVALEPLSTFPSPPATLLAGNPSAAAPLFCSVPPGTPN